MKPFLVTAVGAFLAVGGAAALAEENKFLEIEPLSSDELSAETGAGIEATVEVPADDPLRKRGPDLRNAIGGGQNTVALHSGQTRQLNSTSLTAVNDLVSVRNLAPSAGIGGGAGAGNGG